MPARYSPAEVTGLLYIHLGKSVDKDALELKAWEKKRDRAIESGAEPPARPKRAKRADKDATRFEMVAYLTEEQAGLLRCGRKRTRNVFCKKRALRAEEDAFAAALSAEIREALALLDEVEAAAHAQTLAERCRAYVDAFSDTWDVKKAAVEERHLSYVADSAQAGIPVALLTAEDVERLLNSVPEMSLARAQQRREERKANREGGKWACRYKHLEPLKEPKACGGSTQYNVLRLIRNALDDGVSRGILKQNVARNRTLSKLFPSARKSSNVDPFTQDEVNAIWRHVMAMPLNGTRATLMLVIACGLRPSEGLGLQWRDVRLDGEKPRIHIVRSRAARNSNTEFREGGKTAAAQREIPIPQALVDELRRHMAEDRKKCAAAGVRWSTRNWVSTADDGVNPIWARTLDERFRAILKKEGIVERGIYSLRHSFATENLQRNVPVKTVSRLMGHANESVTLNIYAAYIPSSAEDVVGSYIDLIESAEIPLDSAAVSG